MAIDLMVMPMSRYISGDFVTPAMQFAWANGVPYAIIGAEGKRELPPGLPFGGAEAPLRRAQIAEMVLEDLRALPAEISRDVWDEHSAAEPCFHRVDVSSYEALLAHFAPRSERTFLGLRKRTMLSHCASPLLMPCDFKTPVALVTPFERTAGAASQALRELESPCPPEARAAAQTLRDALADALRLRLPIIVDW
jgi:hypothetical protein